MNKSTNKFMKKDIIAGIFLTLITILLVHFILDKTKNLKNYNSSILLTDTIAVKPVVKEYGFAVDSFNIKRGKIRWNQPLAILFSKMGIEYPIIEKVVQQAKGVFDLRKIKARNKYLVLSSLDSIPKIKYFIYEDSPVEYVVFSLSDSVWVEKRARKISRERKYSSAKIETSLWNSMVDNNLNPVLANELSDIYAWSIDFFGLQKGDSFSVIYDEEYVDSVSIGISSIYAVVFNHMGEEYYAFQFPQDSIISYFDEHGKSLRKTFLKAPLRFNRISSRFSYSRLHPILKIRRPHTGVDYAAPTGTPVHSIGDGIVITKKYSKQGGRTIKIKHNSIYITGYMHLSGYAKNIKVGAKVKQGQLIGYVGKSGLATGPHLDFRFWKNGQPVDPLRVKAPPVEPIKKQNLIAFNKVVKHWLTRLQKYSTNQLKLTSIAVDSILLRP